jgi:hypothetical protein
MYKIKINDRNYEIKTDDKNCENNKNKINDYIYEYLTEIYEIKLYKKSSQLENIDTNIVTNIVTKVSLTMGYDKFFNTINQNTNISNICTFTVTRTEHLILECISCFISCFTQIVHSNDLDKIKDEEIKDEENLCMSCLNDRVNSKVNFVKIIWNSEIPISKQMIANKYNIEIFKTIKKSINLEKGPGIITLHIANENYLYLKIELKIGILYVKIAPETEL